MKKILLISLIFLSNLVFAQKCLVQENQIVRLELPTFFESTSGNVSFGYNTLPDSVHYKDGWREIVTPEYDDSLQYIGLPYFDVNLNVCTYPVINKTQEQLQQEIDERYNQLDAQVDLQSVKKLLQVVIAEKLDSLTDEEFAEAKNIYPVWRVGVDYKVKDIVVLDSILYRVIQPHTSQADWSPKVAASLFAAYRLPAVISDWVQPSAENPYMIGDKVRFNGSIYESLIDNNVWSPAGYPAGWKLL